MNAPNDSAPSGPLLTERATFPLWTREKVRYADTDRQGHVNNAVFSTFLESGRVPFLYDPENPLSPPGCAFVIARLVLDFRAEITWPSIVDIGTVVLKIGRSSFTLGQSIFVGESCVAAAETVIVLVDETTRRSTPMPETLRARLSAHAPRG